MRINDYPSLRPAAHRAEAKAAAVDYRCGLIRFS